MRKLQTHDLFGACRLLNKIGIKDEIKQVCMKADAISEIMTAERGFDLIYALFEKATTDNSEKYIYKFCSGIFEMKEKDIEQLPPTEFIDKFLECADVEEWKGFFKRVASLMKLN